MNAHEYDHLVSARQAPNPPAPADPVVDRIVGPVVDRVVDPVVNGEDPPVRRGREAQRRRTRRAIVTATRELLLAGGPSPTVDAIAAAADVSRRTLYLHFPTLDQLLLDATLGALSDAYIDSGLDRADAGLGAGPGAGRGNGPRAGLGAHARVDALIAAILDHADETLPLGRRLIQLTVDPATASAENDPRTAGPRRGHRRTTWLEAVVEPIADMITVEQHERLVSGLSLLIGFEAMVVLRDVRGLDRAAERRTVTWAAHALIDSILDEGRAADSPVRR